MSTEQPAAGICKDALQCLTFRLDGDCFATEISQVREVLEYTLVTKVPRTPPFLRGVINLRGSVVPVVDLRLQFGMEPTEPTISTCIIIVEVPMDDQTTVIGALADSVQEVVELAQDQLVPPPRMGARINTDYIKAMGKQDEEFVIILNMERVFSAEELTEVDRSVPADVASLEEQNGRPEDPKSS